MVYASTKKIFHKRPCLSEYKSLKAGNHCTGIMGDNSKFPLKEWPLRSGENNKRFQVEKPSGSCLGWEVGHSVTVVWQVPSKSYLLIFQDGNLIK